MPSRIVLDIKEEVRLWVIAGASMKWQFFLSRFKKKIYESQAFTTSDEGILDKLRISSSFSKLISKRNRFGLICT
jgi:hypothetical protein